MATLASPRRAAREPRPPTRRYDPAETRSRVAEAAYQLFAQRGYQATSTADIARAAEVSEGSIFYHFGSKGGLLAELGRLHGEKMVAAMEGGQPLAELDFATTLERCFSFCEANSAWEQLAHAEERPADPCASLEEAEPFFHAARTVTQAWTERHVRTMLDRRGDEAVDAEIAAGLIFAAVADAVGLYLRPGTTVERRMRIRRECIRFCSAAMDFQGEEVS